VCILVHDEDDGSPVCLSNFPSSNEPSFSHDMPVYSFNIDKVLRLIVDLDYAAITSSDSTIGTSIYKSACHIQVTSGGNVVSSEVCHFHSVGNAFVSVGAGELRTFFAVYGTPLTLTSPPEDTLSASSHHTSPGGALVTRGFGVHLEGR
jgi:hypothetical protein